MVCRSRLLRCSSALLTGLVMTLFGAGLLSCATGGGLSTGPARDESGAVELAAVAPSIPAKRSDAATRGEEAALSVFPPTRNRYLVPALGDALPSSWSTEEGNLANVVWSAELGSETYGGPTVIAGLILVGTNNHNPRSGAPTEANNEPVDLGVLMAFSQDTGEFLWQQLHTKGHPNLLDDADHAGSEAFDWPEQGVCSTPTSYRTSAGEQVIAYVSNRGELVSLDLQGKRRFVVDMIERYGVVPHFMSASSPLVVADRMFVVTGNGPDEQGTIPAPSAASFVAVEADSGQAIWQSSVPTSGNEGDPQLFEGQWSSPTYVPSIDSRPPSGTVVFPAGNGVLYGFSWDGRERFRFDANATLSPPPESWQAGAFVGVPVWHEDDQGRGLLLAAVGRNPEGGASGQGQLLALELIHSKGGEAVVVQEAWRFRDPDLGFALASVVVGDAAVYLADLNGFLFAIDRSNGEELWRYDARAPVWATPLVAGGRVYLADSDGDVTVLHDSMDLSVVDEIAMGEPIFASPTAAGNRLFLASRTRLWALATD